MVCYTALILPFLFFKYATEAHQIRETPRHVLASIPVTQKMMKQCHITIDFLSMFHGCRDLPPSNQQLERPRRPTSQQQFNLHIDL